MLRSKLDNKAEEESDDQISSRRSSSVQRHPSTRSSLRKKHLSHREVEEESENEDPNIDSTTKSGHSKRTTRSHSRLTHRRIAILEDGDVDDDSFS